MATDKYVPHIHHGTGHSTGHVLTEKLHEHSAAHFQIASHGIKTHVSGLHHAQVPEYDGIAGTIQTRAFPHKEK